MSNKKPQKFDLSVPTEKASPNTKWVENQIKKVDQQTKGNNPPKGK